MSETQADSDISSLKVLPIPDDDPVLGDLNPNGPDRRDHDHDLCYVVRWDDEADRPKMMWGHKPQHRPGANAPYTRVYAVVRKCRVCGVESKSVPFTDCEFKPGECNYCGASIDADAPNWGACDDCRASIPEADTATRNKVLYRKRRKRYKKAAGELES